MTIIINILLNSFVQIENLTNVYELINKVENQCIKPLKLNIYKEFGSLQDEIDILMIFH